MTTYVKVVWPALTKYHHNKTNAVFLTTGITESYGVKLLVSLTEIVSKVARLSNIQAPEIEIFQSAISAILARDYSP